MLEVSIFSGHGLTSAEGTFQPDCDSIRCRGCLKAKLAGLQESTLELAQDHTVLSQDSVLSEAGPTLA